MAAVLLPDTLQLIRQALLGQSAVTAVVDDRITDRIPGAAVWPLLVVSTVDLLEAGEPWRAVSREQVDVWGTGPGDAAAKAAKDLARTVWQVARALPGTYPAGVLTSCSPALLLSAPDPDTGRAHFVVDFRSESSSQ